MLFSAAMLWQQSRKCEDMYIGFLLLFIGLWGYVLLKVWVAMDHGSREERISILICSAVAAMVLTLVIALITVGVIEIGRGWKI